MLKQNVLRFDVSVKILVAVQILESLDDLSQNLCGLFQGEYPALLLGLLVHQVTPVAVLEHEVDEILVENDLVQFGNERGVHGPHAFDFSVEIILELGSLVDLCLFDLLDGAELVQLLVLDEKDLAVRSSAQPLVDFVPIQGHYNNIY
jgi:hypothetical protein